MASPHTTRQRVQRLRESEDSIHIEKISDHQEDDTSGSVSTTDDEAVDPFAALNPFGPKPANVPTIPSGPICPRIAIPVDRSKSSEGVTRLQARRPPGLQLSKLPPSGRHKTRQRSMLKTALSRAVHVQRRSQMVSNRQRIG
ncbi:hypothetical protein CBOM_07192 [Ceraceosorus bombacis]|uniref:Uncharacterized protein n=1 Tax=Ceraceosorus bombacis TaxID=401625 RepID=A0A0P1B9M4_9BASI|nr:hypothetical protein CBOM_07192 [Ceraceosorus bombacis]